MTGGEAWEGDLLDMNPANHTERKANNIPNVDAKRSKITLRIAERYALQGW
jgi:hypothetical protein